MSIPEITTREEQAKREIGVTHVTPRMARLLAALFVASLVAVPIAQHAWEWRERRADTAAGSPRHGRRRADTAADMAAAWRGAPGGLLGRFLAPNRVLLQRIRDFEDEIDETFLLSRLATAPVQELMCRLGVGNEKVFVGRDGFLFYEPDIRYVTGPGFLDARQLRKRSREGGDRGEAPQPDPVAGIVRFRDELRRHGVELIAMPVPVKPSVEHEALIAFRHRSRDEKSSVAAAPPRNVSYDVFVARLKESGVHVFDPSAVIADVRAREGTAYLKTDTHWNPASLVATANALAGFMRERQLAPGEPGIDYRRRLTTVTNLGDVAVMLKLPASQTLYPAETAVLPVVEQNDGTPWENRADSPILLLGDSFANIYSLADMGWGSGAGLAEQLSAELGAPVERLVRNDAGAYATREMLARDLARGRNRLAGKRVAIWQFAARELAFGDWKTVSLEFGTFAGDTTPSGVSDWLVATVSAVSDRPLRGAVYKDYIMKLYVVGMRDGEDRPFGGGEAVLHVMAMRDREILPVAGVLAGETLRLRVRPWGDVEPRYGSLRTGSLDDIELEIEKPLLWCEAMAE